MRFLRHFALWLSRLGFIFLLGMTVIVTAVVLVFGTSGKIKQALSSSGIYKTVVTSAVDQASKDQAKQPSAKGKDDVPLSDPGIKQAANAALPPSLIQKFAENGVDGVYNWLEGKVELPDFHIDLRSVKKNFAVGVGNYAERRFKTLPVCTPAQLKKLDINNIDVLNLRCRPYYVNIAAERQNLIKKLSSNKDFLKDPVITADNLPKSSEGQNVFEKAKNLPKAFQLFTKSPWLFAILTLGAGALVVFLNTDRRRGIKNASIILVTIGGLFVLDVLALKVGFSALNKSPTVFGKIENTSLQQSVIKIATSLQNSFTKTMLIFAVIYILIGGGALFWLHFTKPKTSTKLAKT